MKEDKIEPHAFISDNKNDIANAEAWQRVLTSAQRICGENFFILIRSTNNKWCVDSLTLNHPATIAPGNMVFANDLVYFSDEDDSQE